MNAEQAFQQAYALSKKYAKETMMGGGAVAGKNVLISGIEPIVGGNRVTFSYTLDNGEKAESYLDVMDGKNGKDGNGIVEVGKIGGEGLVDTYRILFSDGSHIDYQVRNGEQGLQGEQGITPSIGKDNHWFIGDKDTGVSANGLPGNDGEKGDKGEKGDTGNSIIAIESDKNNNIIVTFTDGTKTSIGRLNVDVSADFLTFGGFGNLRYYNSHFQYYDTNMSAWIDTSATPENIYLINITPQPMRKMFGVYDYGLGRYKLKFEEPQDTVVDGQIFCVVEKVIIRRKLGSVPLNENDGDLVYEVKRKYFGNYKDNYFIDNGIIPNLGEVYYYKAFPMSTTGFFNDSSLNETLGILCKDYYLLGFRINKNESDPEAKVEYTEGAVGFTPAKVNLVTGEFDYGSFANFWFVKDNKPVMLYNDGTEAYEFDPNDYTKKADGTVSDVENSSFAGNAMSRIPKTYLKMWESDGYEYCNICDIKLDDDYQAYAHTRENGSEMDYIYLSMFEGSLVSSKVRSIKGLTPMISQTGADELTYAKRNGKGWSTRSWAQRNLINMLLILIGKTTDTQTAFGYGHYAGGPYQSDHLATGGASDKGQFYGTNKAIDYVKVFHIENYWGNTWERIEGCITDGSKRILVKSTPPYNNEGIGYTDTGVTPSVMLAGYISTCVMTKDGLIPETSYGSETTHYTDGLWCDKNCYAITGCSYDDGFFAGALALRLSLAFSISAWSIGASLSCEGNLSE